MAVRLASQIRWVNLVLSPIVVPIPVGGQILDARTPKFRIGQAESYRLGSENPLILINQVVQVAGLRAE